MESVALKRTAIIAVVCFLISIFLYRNLRQATETPAKTEPRTEEKVVVQEKTPAKQLKPGRMSWTLDEAMDAYARDRSNAYLQYVVVQLANQQEELFTAQMRFPELGSILSLKMGAVPAPAQSNRRVNLFSLLAGAHAIQESLQLDALLREGTIQIAGPSVPLGDLPGPTVKSHPWTQLLAGKKPKVSELSRCVPADFYLVEFRSLTKLFDAFESTRDWTAYLGVQGQLDATDPQTRARIQKQLMLDDSPGQRPFYNHFVDQVAITGSDPFVREGSDVTMLFRYEHEAFTRGMELAQERLKRGRLDLSETSGKLLGIPYTACTSPTRDISVYVATVKPHLHVRSNSLAGLRRVLEAITGKDAKGESVERLGDTEEFQYIRTLFPLRAAEEDGLIYLSDPFMRRLLGPATRITEARRMIGYNHLRMIAHAAQLYRSQFGKAPSSLEVLEKTQCAPGQFNAGRLACPFGGTYALSADGTHGISTVLGTTQFLTPCCELPKPDASAQEAADYERMLKDYSKYWQTYFDPIAIRLRTNAKKIRVETLVLPLIDNSIYTLLALALGNRAEPLDALPVPPRNLFSVNLRLNREAYLATHSKAARLHRAKVVRAVQLITAPTTPFRLNDLPPAFAYDENDTGNPPALFSWLGFNGMGIAEEKLDRLFERGIGSQLGLHFYDMPIMFDINLTQLLGELIRFSPLNPSQRPAGASRNNVSMGEATNVLSLAYFVSSIMAPVYLSLPVRDSKVVDDFLDELDAVVSKAASRRSLGPWVRYAGDFYHLQNKFDTKVRAFGVHLEPLRFRFYWARIGDGLYLTNQPYVLEDLHNAYTQRLKSPSPDRGPVGHAMVRMRPQHWQQALPGYKLGWEENNRVACQRNLSMLSAAARAFSTTPPVSKLNPNAEDTRRLVMEYAAQMYGVECHCPDHGKYVLEADGKTFRCTVHGTLDHPTQASAPARSSAVERATSACKDIQATLTILPEGLRAVVVIERK